jgi:hypothetical protein
MQGDGANQCGRANQKPGGGNNLREHKARTLADRLDAVK